MKGETRERLRRIDEVFARALERPVVERPTLLGQLCGGDNDLRHRVEQLLAADSRAAGFLEPPEQAAVSGAPWSESEGRIGLYCLGRKIGSGGAGAVYLARRDDEPERQVAVKVLHSGWQHPETQQRFLKERQLLGRLEHPGIARLYDGGTAEDGRPYLVMEYVEGLPLDEYCDGQRLSVLDRLRLFRKVCAAVEYAHRNLLVHRDLKPDNILVTAAGEPRLLDFGIAKLLDPDRLRGFQTTSTGQRMMTPAYASPEQVRGETVSTASDVYSLGVVLFELLTGRSPYRLENPLLHELEGAVCEQEPTAPSSSIELSSTTGIVTGEGAAQVRSSEAIAKDRGLDPSELRRRLRGDLDHIVLRALRKEPAERYRSVEQLSEDVRRHLRSLPVIARRGSLTYRAVKFGRRHRVTLSALTAVAILVLAFLIALVRQAHELTRERDRAEQSLSFLIDLFKSSEPGRAGGETVPARQILDQGAERLSAELDGSPEVRSTLMDAIGQVYCSLGLFVEAGPLLEQALMLRRQTLGDEHLLVASSLQHLAELRHEEGEYEVAEPLFREALAIRRALLGDLNLDVAESLEGLATLMRWSGQLDGAEPVHLEALRIRRLLLGSQDERVAQSLDSLASLYLRQRDPERAAQHYREALSIQRLTLGEDHPDTAMTLKNLGLAVGAVGDLETAEELIRQALDILRVKLGEEHPWVGLNLVNLGWASLQQGKLDDSEAALLQALAIQRRHLPDQHPDQSSTLHWLALVHSQRGDRAVAADYFAEALQIADTKLGSDHPRTQSIQRAYAELLKELQDPRPSKEALTP